MPNSSSRVSLIALHSHLKASSVERARHQERVARVRQALDAAGIPTLANRGEGVIRKRSVPRGTVG
jgi:hypothetical protein